MKVTASYESTGNVFLTMNCDSLDEPPTDADGNLAEWAMGLANNGVSTRVIASKAGTYDVVVKTDEDPDDESESEEEPVEDDSDIEKNLGYGVVAKTDEERQIVFGWAYVTHDKEGNVVVDKSGEFVDDVEEIERAAYSFVMKSRAGDLDHTNVQSAEMIESMVFTPEKIEKMGIPQGILPSGWWVGFHIADKEQWEIAKTRKAFSIHGKAIRKEVDE